MAERKKILWLVSWYPNKYDRFDGDFIQRHARAAAIYNDVHVIFVKTSSEQNEAEEKLNEFEGLIEQIIYIPKQQGLTGKLKNYHAWRKTYKAAVDYFFQNNKSGLVHIHIPWKVGLIALWIKKKYRIPFIVTEHWGIYNNVVDDNIHTKSFPVRHLLKRIYKQASAFVSVSKYVGKGVNQTLLKKEYSVIPNVVDTSLFYPIKEKNPRFTFLHVSNMVPLKNVEGILTAFDQFLKTGADAQLILIGNRHNQYEQLADKMELLNKSVFFKGEIPYAEVAKEMQGSHVFVLNSNIENSPCVIGEALCCGVPVIATGVGGVPELVEEANGLLILPNNNEALYKAILYVFQNYSRYNTQQIAEQARDKFSFPKVAQQLHLLYNATA